MIALLVSDTNILPSDWFLYAVGLGYGIAGLVAIGALWLFVLHQVDPRWLHRRHGRQAVQREQATIEAERRRELQAAASTGARR